MKPTIIADFYFTFTVVSLKNGNYKIFLVLRGNKETKTEKEKEREREREREGDTKKVRGKRQLDRNSIN